MKLLRVERLKELGTKIFSALGAPRDKAEFVALTLVEASLAGHDSHGVRFFIDYSNNIKKGYIDPSADSVVVKESPSSALVDGRWGFGQVTAMQSMELAVKKAKENIIGAVGVFNCNHIGRVGYYTEWAAKQDIIGMMFVNDGNPLVSVYGGRGRAFGTNPLSISVPTGKEIPFLLDYATSVAALGKVSVAKAKHEKIPRHWARDRYDQMTDDPDVMWKGGWLLPFGEYKGYALLLAMDIIGGALTGSRTALKGVDIPPSANGVFTLAINPEGFIGLEAFKNKTSQLLKYVKDLPPDPGSRILVPGEPEKESKEERLNRGVPLPQETWNQIIELSKELGIEIPRAEV